MGRIPGSLPIFSRISYPKLLILVDNDAILLLHPMEEGEEGRRRRWGRLRNTLNFTVILLQKINFHDMILLPEKVERTLDLLF